MTTKPVVHKYALLLGLLATLNPQLSTVRAQGTAFTYQGQLQNNGGPAGGTYNLTFSLFVSGSGGSAVAGPVTTNGVVITNGLFTVTIDFGPGLFNGTTYWLQIGVETNGANTFTTLAPRQRLTPTPYAIFANTASNLSGSLPGGSVGNSQLVNSSITVNAGTGLSGGGTVALGGTTTLINAGVTALASGGGVTASAASGSVTLGSTATSSNVPNAIVSRDGSGNFSAGAVTLAGALNLPAPTATVYSGSGTLLYSDSYNENFFAGPGAGNVTLSGGANTAVGKSALQSDTAGGDNSAFGDGALSANTGGIANTAIGAAAMSANTNGNYNTAIGIFALFNNTSGSFNTAEGLFALADNTVGYNNTANGYDALVANTGGFNNTASGALALSANTNGNYNVADGYQALYSNLDGNWNTAVGDEALYSNTSGGVNTAIGQGALHHSTSGYDNTAIGCATLVIVDSGHDNTALGNGAGNNIIGNYNIDIGNSGSLADNGIIRIGAQGTQTNAFIAGIYGVTAASGVPVYVNSSDKLGTLTSSAKYKQDIQSMGDASDVLLALKPVTFRYQPGIDPQGIPQFGLVAEDVDKVDPDLVVRDDQHGIYTVRYQAVDAMLLNEFLKEHHKVEEQNTQIQELKQRLAALERIILNQKSN